VDAAGDQVLARLDDLDVLPVRVLEDHELRSLDRAIGRDLRLGVNGIALGCPWAIPGTRPNASSKNSRVRSRFVTVMPM
jgi:hypothetical protein